MAFMPVYSISCNYGLHAQYAKCGLTIALYIMYNQPIFFMLYFSESVQYSGSNNDGIGFWQGLLYRVSSFGRDPTVVSRNKCRGGGVQIDKRTLQVYIGA